MPKVHLSPRSEFEGYLKFLYHLCLTSIYKIGACENRDIGIDLVAAEICFTL